MVRRIVKVRRLRWAPMFGAAVLSAVLFVQVIPGVTVPETEAPAVAAYFADVAVARGDAVRVDGELVPATLDLWAYVALAECESGGDWHIDTGNGFTGGVQFADATWQAVGGVGRAADAPVAEQIERARALVERAGWAPWPVCSKLAGLRK